MYLIITTRSKFVTHLQYKTSARTNQGISIEYEPPVRIEINSTIHVIKMINPIRESQNK